MENANTILSDADAVVGYVDQVIANTIAGWARFGRSVCKVELWVAGAHISTTAANRLRPDLVGVTCEDGKCGFVIFLPARLCDGEERAVEIRFAGTATPLSFGTFRFRHVFTYPTPIITARPDPALGARAKEVLGLLRPMDVIDGRFVRRGRPNDGGYVMLDHRLANSICYSLGINDDVSWDLEMAKDGCTLFQFDHTIEGLPEQHPNFHWQKRGIAARSGGEFASIPDLVAGNRHGDRNDLILKMDIEGFEWQVLETLPAPVLACFSQIVAEFHMLSIIDQDEHYRVVQACLRQLNQTHTLVHIHANNCGHLGWLGGVTLPDTFEVTYVRSTEHRFTECKRVFPTELDMPCNPNAADFYLGALGLNP